MTLSMDNTNMTMVLFLSFIILLVISTCSIVLQFRTYLAIKEVAKNQDFYLKEFDVFKDKLISIRTQLIAEESVDLKTISDIRTLLYSFQNKGKDALTNDDTEHLRIIMNLLIMGNENFSPSDIEIPRLCAELDYFIARFDRTTSIFANPEIKSSRVSL